MKPSAVAASLRQIADKIAGSKRPSISAVFKQIQRIADQIENQVVEDVNNLMEKGLPRIDSGDPKVIKSMYTLDKADIFYSYKTGHYDRNDKWETLPDTKQTQENLKETSGSVTALIIWPDCDLLYDFDNNGSILSGNSHQIDPETGKASNGPYISDLGIKNFSEIEKAAGPGSWVLNSQLILKAKEHSYNIGKNLN